MKIKKTWAYSVIQQDHKVKLTRIGKKRPVLVRKCSTVSQCDTVFDKLWKKAQNDTEKLEFQTVHNLRTIHPVIILLPLAAFFVLRRK